MTQRYRSRKKDHTQGTYTVYSVFSPRTHGGAVLPKSTETSDDTVSKLPYHEPHDLDLTVKSLVAPWYMTGEWLKSPSVLYRINDHYTPDYGLFSTSTGIPSTNLENWSFWFTKAIVNMNPNVPVTDVPLFVLELRDFPKLLKNLGDWLNFLSGRKSKGTKKLLSEFRGLAKSEDPLTLIPDSFLTYNFGWAPLLADLKNLQGFQQQWEAKLKDLSKMKGGTRVKRSLYKSDETSDDAYYVWLFAAAGIWVPYSVRKEEHIWFTSYPTLLSDVPKLDDNESFQSLMYGLNDLRISTVWNTLPWSWLIDYFYNVSDVLNASGGELDWEYDKVCLMSSQTHTYTSGPIPLPPGISTTRLPMAVSSSKRRRVGNHPTPTFSRTPWLSQKQKGNLGALSLMLILGIG